MEIHQETEDDAELRSPHGGEWATVRVLQVPFVGWSPSLAAEGVAGPQSYIGAIRSWSGFRFWQCSTGTDKEASRARILADSGNLLRRMDEPVSKSVQGGEPIPNRHKIKDFWRKPIANQPSFHRSTSQGASSSTIGLTN